MKLHSSYPATTRVGDAARARQHFLAPAGNCREFTGRKVKNVFLWAAAESGWRWEVVEGERGMVEREEGVGKRGWRSSEASEQWSTLQQPTNQPSLLL